MREASQVLSGARLRDARGEDAATLADLSTQLGYALEAARVASHLADIAAARAGARPEASARATDCPRSGLPGGFVGHVARAAGYVAAS